MFDGVMLLWWILTIPSFLFVVIDVWRTTPESPVLKWAFVILTAFTGPLGAFFYVLGCREPLRGNHEQYVAARWRQVLGSTMHCVAGDGIGIVVGAAIGGVLTLPFWPDFLLEYVLGFGFGWALFQAFAMRDAAGGSYTKSLKMTFLPELLSMNLLMTGMIITSSFAMRNRGRRRRPDAAAVLVPHVDGADRRIRLCLPDQLVARRHHMKHGMMTIRPKPAAVATEGHSMDAMSHEMSAGSGSGQHQPSAGVKAAMTVLTFAILGVALVIVVRFAM